MMAVVAVNTLCLDLFAIDIYDLANYLNFLKAYVKSDIFASAMNNERVEIRRFVIPKHRIVYRNGKLGGRGSLSAGYLHSVGGEKAVIVVKSDIRRKLWGPSCRLVSVGKRGVDKDIAYVLFVARKQIYLAEDTRISVFVLTFKISSVAPFEDENLYIINADL